MLPEGLISGPNRHGYTIKKVDRFDAGRYTCTAGNGVGVAATAHINLQVLCKCLSFLKVFFNKTFHVIYSQGLRTLTIGGSNTVLLTSCLTGLDLTKQLKLLCI